MLGCAPQITNRNAEAAYIPSRKSFAFFLVLHNYKFITVAAKFRHWVLSWDTEIQFIFQKDRKCSSLQFNAEASTDLCILGPPQMVVPFNTRSVTHVVVVVVHNCARSRTLLLLLSVCGYFPFRNPLFFTYLLILLTILVSRNPEYNPVEMFCNFWRKSSISLQFLCMFTV